MTASGSFRSLAALGTNCCSADKAPIRRDGPNGSIRHIVSAAQGSNDGEPDVRCWRKTVWPPTKRPTSKWRSIRGLRYAIA